MPRFENSHKLLSGAGSEREVERALFAAIEDLDPEELKVLPPECLAVVFSRKGDVHDAAVTLLQCDLKHRGEEVVGALLHELAQLYAAASVRLSQLERWRTLIPQVRTSNSG